MSRVRSDKRWKSGTLHDQGDGTWVLMLECETVFHGHQRMSAVARLNPNSIGQRLCCICPNRSCQRYLTTLFRPHGGAYVLCRHCWDILYASQ